jgi:hypothetical protein
MRLDGTHTFSVEAAGSESIVRHEIDATPSSIMKLLWPALIEPLHNALTEDAFDNIEAAVAARAVTRVRLSGAVRRRRRVMAALRPRPIPKDTAGSLARGASVPTAAALGGLAILHAAWARGSTWPYADRASFVRSVIGSSNPTKFPGAGASRSVAALLGVATMAFRRSQPMRMPFRRPARIATPFSAMPVEVRQSRPDFRIRHRGTGGARRRAGHLFVWRRPVRGRW